VRVVSLVPSLTETLFHLGLTEAEVVGVTKWCIHPAPRVAGVEKVGGTKDPDVARVVALRPDLVVANFEENRREDVQALQGAGLRVLVTDVRTVGDAPGMVLDLGRALGREREARALAGEIEGAAARAFDLASERPEVSVYCPIWRRPWMTVNADTFAASMLKLAGAHNVFDAEPKRYPEKGPEEAVARGATACLLPSEPYPFQEKHVPELVAAGFARERVRFIDGEALTWYGARTPDGIATILREIEALRPPEARDPRLAPP
jgi:ABC-type Fe3+-hydroxamate transport system substrate-binding protein